MSIIGSDWLVCHGECVENVESVVEGVELELYVRSLGERERRYLTAGVHVQTVDELAAHVEQRQEVADADTRRRADRNHKVRLRRHTYTPVHTAWRGLQATAVRTIQRRRVELAAASCVR